VRRTAAPQRRVQRLKWAPATAIEPAVLSSAEPGRRRGSGCRPG
jgi:hypothetical protein